MLTQKNHLRMRPFTLTTAASFLILSIISMFFPISGSAQSLVDFSYDKCAGNSRSVSGDVGHYAQGIVGVNAGGDWEKNPCLGNEIKHFNKYALYANTNYPSTGCPTAVNRHDAYNCGYSLGQWDVAYASSQGAHSSAWFIDVEDPGVSWHAGDSLDSVFLYGLASGLQTRGASFIAFYSTGYMWGQITGNWRSGNDSWYATGVTHQPSSSTIDSDCRDKFTGGNVVYYQYLDGSFDIDKTC